ncbi:hypothetical protein M1384_01750 [Candidatus Parvarchaeota archaeon]|nr:hypothetical protein [Candidatus Parvarchaeota archaeon]
MKSFIQGIIPNISGMSKNSKLLYIFFSSSDMFLVEDSKVDSILSESPIGMWPASGAVIDASTPSAVLSNFKENMDKTCSETIDYDYLNKLSYLVVNYLDIKKFRLLSDNITLMKIEIETSKETLNFMTDYIDSALLEEYKKMLFSLFGSRFLSN